MVIRCASPGCNHPKTKHEDTYDCGKNSGACTVKGCPCGNEIFGFTYPKKGSVDQ